MGLICHLLNMKINILSDRGSHKRYSYNTITTYSYVDPLNLQIKNICQNISNNSKNLANKNT